MPKIWHKLPGSDKFLVWKDGKERKKKKKDWKLLITIASALQTQPWVAHAKPPGPKSQVF